MSKYTQTIKSILMENKQAGESISNINDIYTIANRCLFDIAPMNVIDSDYRQRLITGFTLHFMNDEIGLETMLLWKLGLSDKIYNNAEYINAIFENLDKQILADYHTKVAENTLHNTIVDETTIADTGTTETAHTGDDTLKLTGSASDGKSGSDSLTRTGTVTDAKSGYDTNAQTGTQTDAKSGYDTKANTGTQGNAHTGTVGKTSHTDDILEKSGTETTTYNEATSSVTDGTVVTAGGDKYTETNSNNSTSKSNSGTFFQDTPMNNLMNMRETATTPAARYDSTGKGILAASESNMNYLTNATLDDNTTVNQGGSSVSHDASQSRTQEDNDTTVNGTHTGTQALGFTNREDDRDVDYTETNTFNESNTRTDDLTERDTYNSQNQRTNNLTDTATYNSQNQTTNDTLDTTSYNSTMTHTENRQNKQEYNSESTTTNDLLRTTNKDATIDNEHSINEVNTALNLEMIYRSMPLLNKVWEIFDELFMMLY